MATAKRQAEPAVTAPERLLESSRGGFHAVLRILERELVRDDPNATRVGLDGPAERETLRLHANPAHAFPAAELTAIEAAAPPERARYRLRTNIMALTGPGGVLPGHYTNTMARRARDREHALSDFLNIFDHRLLSLLHRAWAKYRPALGLEEAHGAGTRPAYTRAVDALSGRPPSRGHDDQRYYAGHFARGTRSAAGLTTLLADYLGHPVAVQPLVGQWLLLEHRDRTRLGSNGRGANNHLGSGVLAGRRVWSIDSRVTVHIGPLSHAEHRALIPGTPRYRGLRRLIADYVPPGLTVDIKYHLAEDAGRPPPLGGDLRLGRTAWLGGRDTALSPASLRLERNG